ncbi:MFS transporter [Roseburia sp. 499]|uniref:MFS transporter n=1 Tax=Roseburia sp. 499 TaxID=1261634 RepID=UPI0009531E9F|nr:MFS transporter [Roseburia sp. 499]WVK69528.1 MFS transporter [Roseburia sp. 499]
MSQNKISKRGYSTLQLILASFAFGSIMVFWTIYNSYVPLILDEKLGDLGSITLSAATISTLIGFIMAIDNFFGLIFQPLFGKKSDYMRSRYGKRMPYVIVGIVLCSILFVLIPVMGRISGVTGILAMMVVIIAFNFIMSTWRAPCVAIMPDIVPAEYQSEGNAVVNMVSAVFTIVASASAGILGVFGFREAIDGGNYLAVFIFGSIVAVFCLVILLTCVKWVDNRKGAKEEKVHQEKEKRETLRNLNLPADAKRSMFIMMVALFCISGTSDGVGTYFTLYATKLLSLDATTATMIKTVGTLGGVLLAVPAGIAGRKLGRRKTILTGLSIVIVMHVFMFAMPGFAGDYITVLLAACYFIYAGAFIMININTLPIMLSIGGKERFGAFTGYYYFATFTAAVVCPVIMGFVVGMTNYNMIHMIALVMMVVAIFCVFHVHHGEKMIEEEQ